jgi:hypothetical protein
MAGYGKPAIEPAFTYHSSLYQPPMSMAAPPYLADRAPYPLYNPYMVYGGTFGPAQQFTPDKSKQEYICNHMSAHFTIIIVITIHIFINWCVESILYKKKLYALVLLIFSLSFNVLMFRPTGVVPLLLRKHTKSISPTPISSLLWK